MAVAFFRRWWNAEYEAVLLPEPLRAETVDLLQAGDYYGAIKLVKRRTDLGLTTAKRAVDALGEAEGIPRQR